MLLIERIRQQHRIISVVGMAKNAGKTVTLNELIHQSERTGIRLGLTSIGRDGERQDLVTKTDKPRIYVHEGTLIATAQSLVDSADAGLEIHEVTKCHTPMGAIVIAVVRRPGFVEIAGPSINADILKVSNQLLKLGADLVIVDGALDRIASASPAITEGTLLATGAVLSRDMNKVIAETAHRVGLFKLPCYDVDASAHREAAVQAVSNKTICLIQNDGHIEEIPLKTAIQAGTVIGRAITDETAVVILPGALVTKTLHDLILASDHVKCGRVTLVVQDATRIFVESRDWLQLSHSGLRVEVIDPIHLIAVTVNPYAPQGYYFDPVLFKEAMQAYMVETPVLDVMGEDAC